MRARRLMTAALAIGIVAFSGVALRAQVSFSFTFGDQDRQAMRDWYGNHYNAPEFQDQRRWNNQYEQRLQVGLVLAPDLQAWARPAPQDLYGRLAPLPRGYRYVIVGDHVLVVDGQWRIYDVNHFERFDNPDQQVTRDWYGGNRDASVFNGRQGWNDQFEQRIQVGGVLDRDLRKMSRPVPAELLRQLPRRPSSLRYVIIGDHICLIDNWWTVCDVLHLERAGNAPNYQTQNNYGNQRLQIARAEYGTGGRMMDVTNRLNSQMQRGQLKLQVTNQTMGGDPSKGQRKALTIRYTYDGRNDQATVYEGDYLNLPGPQGQGRQR